MKSISQFSRFGPTRVHARKKVMFLASVLAVGLLTAPELLLAQSDSEKRPARKAASNTLVVAGVAIDKSKLEYLITERVRMGQQDSQGLREAMASELVQRELLLQEAKRRGLDRQAATRVQQEIASDRILAGIFVNQFISENPVTDEMIKKEYDDFIKRAGSEEILIRQVLLPTLEDAKGVLARITAGEKFEEVASKVSRDGASRQQGGLTGWVPTTLLQPNIAAAVKGLSKGTLAKEAVQTPAGWHVIRVEDKRAYTKPKLGDVRAQIQQQLQQRLIDEHMKSLLAKAQTKN